MPFLASLLLLSSLSPQEEPWSEYRGPSHDGHAPASARPPLGWAEDHNVRWKTAVPGRGWSTPAVAAGRVWLTTADPEGHHLSVLCLDFEGGAVLLERELFEVPEPQVRNPLNSFASPSPVVEPGRVYLFFGNEGLVCLDSSTFEELWRRTDLNCDHLMGAGSSPLLHDGRLFINVDGADVQYVVALDARTGKTVWKTARDKVLLKEFVPDLRKAYSTPVVAEVDGEDQLISSGAQVTMAYEVSSGEEIWRVRHGGFSMSSRPVLHEGTVLLNTGFATPWLWSVRLGGEGDVTATHVAWKLGRGMPTMPSPVVVDGVLYTVSDGGVACSVDLESGEQIWRQRLGSEFSASPLYAGGRLYFFDREGRTTVVEPGPEYKQLATNQLDAGCMASAAVAGDALLVRTKTHVYRIEVAPDAQGADGCPD